MGTLNPTQDYAHLVGAKAGSDGNYDLKIVGGVKTGQTFNRGALVSFDTSFATDGLPQFITGCGPSAMPMWAVNGTGDFDVESDIGNIIPVKVNAWVATGGFELFTTEYDTDPTYAPNDPLIPDTTDAIVTKGTSYYGSSVVCGVVSRGEQADAYSQSVLFFWPVFIPGAALT